MRSQFIIFLIVFTLFSACTGTPLPKYALVSNLRIIALKATSPEVSPGDPLPAVSSLVLDPEGGGRTVTYAWVGCVEPVSSAATRYDCEGAADKVSLGSGTSTTAGAINIPATMLALLPTSKAYNGYNYIVSLTVTAGSDSHTAFKRIVVSTKPTKNTNPTVNSFKRNGTSLTNGDAVNSGDQTLTIDVAPADFEAYSYYDANGNLKNSTEDILVTWYITEGTIKTARTFGGNFTNTWTPPSPKARPQVSLAVVIHDGRGGSDWKTVNLQ